jgi:hypothetical protein
MASPLHVTVKSSKIGTNAVVYCIVSLILCINNDNQFVVSFRPLSLSTGSLINQHQKQDNVQYPQIRFLPLKESFNDDSNSYHTNDYKTSNLGGSKRQQIKKWKKQQLQ